MVEYIIHEILDEFLPCNRQSTRFDIQLIENNLRNGRKTVEERQLDDREVEFCRFIQDGFWN